MGFEGTVVTPQIRKLISEHHIGSILLKASNLKCELAIVVLGLFAILTSDSGRTDYTTDLRTPKDCS
jgi:hypothetical protein